MNWFRRVVGRRRLYADLSAEIRLHLEEKIDSLVESGMSRPEATALAHREFGNIALVEERSRDVWRWMLVEDCLTDLSYALRQLRRHPAFTLVALVTLAVAIGANAAVFSVVNTVVLRPLPFPEPDRLVSVQSLNTKRGQATSLSYPDFFDVRAENRVLERIVSYRDNSFNVTVADRTVHVEGEIVSWDLFQVLGVEPLLGRGFVRSDEQAGSRVVVLGYGLWQELFGGDSSVLGRSITLAGEAYTVVGVAPPDFRFPIDRASVQLWTTVAVDAPSWPQRGARMLNAVGRLKPGVTIEQAGAQMTVIAGALARQYPEHNANHARILVRPELERVAGDTRRPLLVLMGAVLAILLIACANIASLLLARTEERRREFAVRASIGASRHRLIRQLLTEGLLLAVLGGAAGVGVAAATIHAIPAALADAVPRIQQVAIDGDVVLFAAAVVLFTCVVFSLSPAWQQARTAVADRLQDGGHAIAPGRDRLGGALVVGQIALSLALVSAATLLAVTLINSQKQDPGFRPDNAVKFSVSLPAAQYEESRSIVFYERLFERLSGIRGVQSVAGGGPLPLTGNQMTIAFTVPGRPTSAADRPRANAAIVTPGYFRTLGIPHLEGRDFGERDDAASPAVVIVNQAFANRFFPGEDPIGKGIQPGVGADPHGPAIRQIVGVIGNARQFPFSGADTPVYYMPFRQVPWFVDAVIVRTAIPHAALASIIQTEVASLDKQAAVHHLAPLSELQTRTIAVPRFLTLLLGSFAAMALLLAAVGLYGVLSHSVGRRTNEIGVRMALGATRASVLAMVLRQAMVLVAAGLAIGLGTALAGSRVLAGLLYGVEPRDPFLLATACSIIGLAGIVAACIPAHRAASIEPMRALRAE